LEGGKRSNRKMAQSFDGSPWGEGRKEASGSRKEDGPTRIPMKKGEKI